MDPLVPAKGSKDHNTQFDFLTPVGKIARTYNTSFSYRPSVYFKRWVNFSHPKLPSTQEWCTPHLRSWDALLAEYKGLKKYDIDRPPVPKALFYDHLRDKYSQWGPSRLLSFSESVDSANLTSTCGYPMNRWFRSMRSLLENCDYEAWLRFYDSVIDQLPVPTIWVSFLKDEVLPLHKLNDPRQINGPSVWYKLYAGTCTYDYNHAFVDEWSQYPSVQTVGIDLFSPDWDRLMRDVSSYSHVYCTDAHRFDSTFPKEAFDVICQFRSDLLPPGEARRRLHLVYGGIRDSWCLCADGFVYFVQGGNKSGSLTTTEDNCMWNSFTTFYSLKTMGYPDSQWTQWVYGDDSLLATNFELDLDAFFAEKKKLGLQVTLETPVDDIVYMSRANLVCSDGFNTSISSRPGKLLFSLANDKRNMSPLEAFLKACAIRDALYGVDEYFKLADSYCRFLAGQYRAILSSYVGVVYLPTLYLDSIRRGYIIRCLNEINPQPDKNKQSRLHVMSTTKNTNSNSASRLSRRLSRVEGRLNKGVGRPRRSISRPALSKKSRNLALSQMRSSVASVKLPGQNLESFTRTRSSYFRTLEDPFRNDGVKIPDDSTFPSSTFSVSFKRQINAIESSDTGTWFCGYMVNSWQPFGCLNYALTYHSGTGAISWMSDSFGGTVIVPEGGPVHNWPEIEELYREGRIVSAGITIMPAMSSMSDKGVLYSTNIPVMNIDYSAKTDTDFSTLSGIQNSFTSIQSPIRDGGSCVCYRPCDPRSYTYSDWSSPTSGEPNLYYGGAVVFAVGLDSEAVMEVTIVINFEAIPNNSSFSLVSPTPSPRDTLEMDHATNEIAKIPAVEAGDGATKKAQETATSGVVHNNHKPNKQSFGSKVLSFLGGAAKKVLPVALEALTTLL